MKKTFLAAVALLLLAAALIGWNNRQTFPYVYENDAGRMTVYGHVHCFPHVQWSTEDWLPEFTNRCRDSFRHHGFYLRVMIVRPSEIEYFNQ